MNKQLDVIVGLQWGDEGKGKVVDKLTPQYKTVARFQGGPNAGHTLVFGERKFVLHSIPSGIFNEGVVNLIGNGVVLDPVVLTQEIEHLHTQGVATQGKIWLSKKAHLILPTHRLIDAAQESAKAGAKIGSTLRGIGPTYTDKTNRVGLRVGDVLQPNFKQKYAAAKEQHLQYLSSFKGTFELDAQAEQKWLQSIDTLQKYVSIVDGEYALNERLQTSNVLAEGAQGAMLDVDFGSYPFVTSSSTISAGACTGLGVAPQRIGEVFGVFKAYCTRVGSGPFPTELNDAVGEQLRQQGGEFGSTTGRSRRCGWLDLVALRYAVMLTGTTQLCVMKADVMDNFDTIKVAVGYKINGIETDQYPYETDAQIEPIYREFEGWKQDISACRSQQDLPKKLLDYLKFIELQIGVPITFVSTGADRDSGCSIG
ncbi:adenylosuccinate synthetase [Bacteroidia bacterium]|nr:adenylosuccinate synthetase [Bacteroidia bacterium]